ncbi:hypothetical protein F5879DRAFT_1022849 [Lentinula edodes]|nr:hypothetical protein F5879DRAFT_1022849 [Lentinula edodes]
MAEGMVKDAGNDMITPDAYLTMFDERRTTFKYKFFNSNMIWRVTGVSPNRYCMVHDEEKMGLCGGLDENYEQSTFYVLKLFIKLSFPNTFRVILSQHRRLSTVHNLALPSIINIGSRSMWSSTVVGLDLTVYNPKSHTRIPRYLLILLAIILGLLGLLIAVTSRKVAYVKPGQTRMVFGDKGGNHDRGDKERV